MQLIQFRSSFLMIAALTGTATQPACADVDVFQTPSHNIQCTIGMDFNTPSDIECEIEQTEGPPALPRPAGCKARMRSVGTVRIDCAELPVIEPENNVLEYGGTHDFLGIFCTSSRQGFSCGNRDGHGFFLSRAKQTIH